jgi:hypothetical protein
MDYNFNKVMKITAMMKFSLLALIYLGYHFFPFNIQNYQLNSLGPAPPVDFWATLKTWDAQHYLLLAEHGYAPEQMSNAFYPLFPILIGVFRFLFFNNTLASGLFLSHLFTFTAMAYLYLLTRKIYGEKTAYYSCLLLLAFPASFYLGLVYTESLFLALTAALFYYAGESRILPAILCAVLLTMTRPTGLLVLLPVLAGLFFKEYFQGKNFNFKKWLLPAGFLTGYIVYLGFMKLLTGDCFAAAHAEKYFLTNYSTAHLFHPVDWFVMNFIKTDFSIGGLHSGILNRLLFAAYLLVLVFARRHLNRTLFFYSLVLGFIPALSGDFASYMRYMVVLFPLFIFLAVKLKDKSEYYLLAFLPLQALFCLAHTLYYWVA